MQILSPGESFLLGSRFARLVKWLLVLIGLLACMITLFSVLLDRQTARTQAALANQNISTVMLSLAETVLDQAYANLSGMAVDADRMDDAQKFMTQAAPRMLRRAAMFGATAAYLYVKTGNRLMAVDVHGEISEEGSELARQTPTPPHTDEPFLSVPLRASDGHYLLPLQLSSPGDGPSTPPLVFGALIPLERFNPPARLAAGHGIEEGGHGMFLPNGQVILRSANLDRAVSQFAPESTDPARAATAAGGPFHTLAPSGRGLSGHFARSMRYGFIVASGAIDNAVADPWRERATIKVGLLLFLLLVLATIGQVLLRSINSLASSNTLYQRLFLDVTDAVMFQTPSGEVKALNQAALRLTGMKSEVDVIGHNVAEFFPLPIDAHTGRITKFASERIDRALAGEQLRYPYGFDSPITHQHFDCDVHLSAFDLGGQPMLLAVAQDKTAERRHVRQQEYLANHDLLTGLPNRYHLLRRLDRHIGQRPDALLQLVLINFTRFREVNESFGHRTGDTVLEVVAQRLAQSLNKQNWMLARLGGTDLVALCDSETGLSAEELSRLVLRVTAQPISVGASAVELHVVLGHACFPEDALDASQLLRCAEQAASYAKLVNQRFARYNREFDRAPGHDLKLRSDLSTAIREGQLRLAFQPKVRLDRHALAGVEALLRWEHPRRGWIAPGEFIGLAESTELIHPLTRWVLGAAVDQIALWMRAGQPLKVAINVSINNLQDPDFTPFVKDLLAHKEVPPELIELEVTEGALARNPEIVLRRLQDLRATGMSLALDDFGTGFSSLSYVSQFPFTSIKIDRSFILALLSSANDRHVTESTITLGHNLGLQVVAEGVEDEVSAQVLRSLGCDLGQGYLFGRPMLAPEFEQWCAEYEAKAEAHPSASALT